MKNFVFVLSFVLFACSEQKPADSPPESAKENLSQDAPATAAPAKKKLPDGPYKEYFPGGTVKIEGVVTAGERDGVWTSYHSNGLKASENHYLIGQLHGKTTSWQDNGMLYYIGYYSHGKKSGKWIFFNREGEPIREEVF